MSQEQNLTEPIQAEWYYVGHYGQLGPLTLEQMGELAQDGVIDGETYVWRAGMSDWSKAVSTPELGSKLMRGSGVGTYSQPAGPPPMPGSPERAAAEAQNQFRTVQGQGAPPGFQPQPQTFTTPQNVMNPTGFNPGFGNYSRFGTAIKSDKSRVLAGVLNLLIPGVGRLYLGYSAHGVMQLLSTVMCGIGYLWSMIDGIYILVGGVKYDGYGRELEN